MICVYWQTIFSVMMKPVVCLIWTISRVLSVKCSSTNRGAWYSNCGFCEYRKRKSHSLLDQACDQRFSNHLLHGEFSRGSDPIVYVDDSRE